MGLHTRTVLLLLLLVLLLAGVAGSSRRRRPRPRGSRSRSWRQCQAIPRFRVNDVEPLELARGHVTLVALLTSDCPFCVAQSERLQILRSQLESEGREVHMMIINAGPRPQPGEEGTFERRVSFPVYHDDNTRTIWREVFRGGKDDIFTIDRCGQLTYRIPFPYSYLGYNYVRRALTYTFNGSVCDCPEQDVHQRMMGDAPFSSRLGNIHSPYYGNYGRYRPGRRSQGLRRRGHSRPYRYHRNMNRSRCPREDSLCQDLHKARRRYNQFRRQNRAHLLPGMQEEEILHLFERSQVGSVGPAL